MDEIAKSTDSTSRPPRPPACTRVTSIPSGASPPPSNGDGDFVNDDWDESFEESPYKASHEKTQDRLHVVTGSRPDHNWLEDDFDD